MGYSRELTDVKSGKGKQVSRRSGLWCLGKEDGLLVPDSGRWTSVDSYRAGPEVGREGYVCVGRRSSVSQKIK